MKPAKALATAAARGDLQTMRDMLNEDKTLAAHWQPIMDACYVGQADAVALLLENGADPNIKSKSAHHYRPLHRTVEFKKTAPKHDGHHQVVDLLLDAGADPLMPGSYWLISAIALCATGDSIEFLPANAEEGARETRHLPRRRPRRRRACRRSFESRSFPREGSPRRHETLDGRRRLDTAKLLCVFACRGGTARKRARGWHRLRGR